MDDKFPLNLNIQRYVLENRPYEVCIRINPEVREDVDYLGRKVVRILNQIAVRQIERITYSWPADWKEAVKERFAPKWFKNKWPVKYTRKNHVLYMHCPEFDITGRESIVVVETDMPRVRCNAQ